MDERDWELLGLYAVIALAGVALILQSKVLAAHDERLIRHDEDIMFLRLVTRGLEEKVAE